MKMIYVAPLTTEPDRDSSWIDAFASLGCEVLTFGTFFNVQKEGIVDRIFRRFNIGKANRQMQLDLLKLAAVEHPDWIHFRLPLNFDRKTIFSLRNNGIIITQYFNDDPFSRRAPFGLHWKYRNAIPAYNAHFVFRALNIQSYLNVGASHVEHCPPYYDPKLYINSTSSTALNRFLADVAFIGHWENDWRVDCLDSLIRHGYSVILKGGMWDQAIQGREIGKLAPITHAFGEEYNHIYANVVAGLCFFSKINNDTWTRRALEIVAAGGVLVCERTDEAQKYFKDREEAYFFSSIEELIKIVEDLKSNPAKRHHVRAAGYERLLNSRNTINDRAKEVYKFVENNRRANP